MKNKILAFSILCGALFWLVDAVLDYIFFYKGNFLRLLIFHVPAHEIYIRSIAIILFFIFGRIITKFLIQQEMIKNEIEDEQKKAQKYLDIAAVMLVVVDKDQRVSLINKKGCDVLDYREDEIIGKNWFNNFIPERMRPEVLEVFYTLLAGNIESVHYVENLIITKNNEEKLIAWHNTIIKDENDNIISMLASGEDITQYKKTEDQLKKSENQMRMILNALPDMILKLDTNLRIFWANKAALDINPNVIGETCYTVHMGEKKPCENCPCLSALKTGKMQTGIQYHTNLHGIQGESYWEDIGIPLKDNTGKVIGLIVIARNVTERKLAEKELQRSHDALENKVAERTKELTQANLRLQELDRLKNMFVLSMSHELRTPLNAIIGFTGVLLMGMTGNITGEQRNQLNIIKKNAHHLLILINNIIDVSKIEAGKIHPTLTKFNLSALLQEVKDSFDLLAAKKGIMIYLKMTEKLFIRSDKHQIKQALINLMDNALKFTDRGKIEIKATTKGAMVKISIKDTGIGIDKKDMDKLFKAFSQISVEGQLNPDGVGIGLYLTKKIINLLGGRITVKSEAGRGSEFVITLPCLSLALTNYENLSV